MISVVIPLYNKETTIERAIASVIAQSVDDWELIVVDDGSSDSGPARVIHFGDPRVRLVSQANAGVSAARNRGAELSNTDVVAFLDADDYWAPDHLANLKLLVTSFPGATVFATAYFMIAEAGRVQKVCIRGIERDNEPVRLSNYFASAAGVAPPVHSSAVAVDKRALSEIGGFPVGLKAGEDLITWARLACIGDVAYSARATAYFNAPPVSVNRREVIRRPQKPDYVAGELRQLSTQFGHLFGTGLKSYLGDWHRMRAMLFMELDERRDSVVELSQAIRASGVRPRDLISLGLLMLPAFGRTPLLSRWRQFRASRSGTAR